MTFHVYSLSMPSHETLLLTQIGLCCDIVGSTLVALDIFSRNGTLNRILTAINTYTSERCRLQRFLSAIEGQKWIVIVMFFMIMGGIICVLLGVYLNMEVLVNIWGISGAILGVIALLYFLAMLLRRFIRLQNQITSRVEYVRASGLLLLVSGFILQLMATIY